MIIRPCYWEGSQISKFNLINRGSPRPETNIGVDQWYKECVNEIIVLVNDKIAKIEANQKAELVRLEKQRQQIIQENYSKTEITNIPKVEIETSK